MRTQENDPKSTTSIHPQSVSSRRGQEPVQKLARREDLFGPLWHEPLFAMRRLWNQWPFEPLWHQAGIGGSFADWAPQIESFHRGNEFVVRADLPGLDKKDISVEVREDALVIQGERANEHEHREEGHYLSERNYGHFSRVVVLPEGAIANSVKASFRKGVLEVSVQAPPHEASRGRQIEIADGAD